MLCFQYVGIILDFIVWARRMFAAGLDIDTKAYFTAVLSVICSSLPLFPYHAQLSHESLAFEFLKICFFSPSSLLIADKASHNVILTPSVVNSDLLRNGAALL